MRIVCQSCRKKYNLPDEKLPAGRKVMFHCPACKAPIRLDLRSCSKTRQRDEIPSPGNIRKKRPLERPADVDSKQLWRHSLAVAFGSTIIAKKKHPALEGEIFAAGLIHDVGKTILDKQVYDRRESFEMFMHDGEETFLNAEREILGFDHAEIASELCLKWNLSEEQAQGIRHHHSPSRSQGSILAYIIHVSDYLAMNSDFGYGIDSGLYQIEQGAREFLGLKEEDDEEIINEIMKAVQESEQDIG